MERLLPIVSKISRLNKADIFQMSEKTKFGFADSRLQQYYFEQGNFSILDLKKRRMEKEGEREERNGRFITLGRKKRLARMRERNRNRETNITSFANEGVSTSKTNDDISWSEGWRVVELTVLVDELSICCNKDCEKLLHLKIPYLKKVVVWLVFVWSSVN